MGKEMEKFGFDARQERRCFDRCVEYLRSMESLRPVYGSHVAIEAALEREFGVETVREMLRTYPSGDYDLFGRPFEGKVYEVESDDGLSMESMTVTSRADARQMAREEEIRRFGPKVVAIKYRNDGLVRRIWRREARYWRATAKKVFR